MNKSKQLVTKAIVLSLMTSTALYATNGDTLIAVGAKARGMGGTGIAMSHGAESTLTNPALITTVENTEISFGGTIFMPTITTSMGMAPAYDSSNNLSVIPSVSIATKIDEHWYIGIGMWGTAGMGVDYRNAPIIPMRDSGNMHMVTNLQLMQFGIPIAYKNSGFSIAVTPILQYGALDINYNDFTGSSVGAGVGQDLVFGYSVGASYDFAEIGAEGLMVGFVYKSKIDMEYGDQLSVATQPFADVGIFPGAMPNHLEQPAEIGVGFAYTMEGHSVAVDYKKIQWSKAQGYQDFGWEDQDVFSVGYQYAQDNWAFRLGYNHASSPLTEMQSGPQVITPGNYFMAGGNAMNLFNLLGFPATAENHYTIGGTYEFNDQMAIDLAYVYAPTTTTTMNTIVGLNPMTGDMYTGPSSVDHKESSITVQLSYKF